MLPETEQVQHDALGKTYETTLTKKGPENQMKNWEFKKAQNEIITDWQPRYDNGKNW